jgi:hypothetical protein
MANRCARCLNEDVTLKTFGVFRCPACGRVDADGRCLDAPPAPPSGAAEGTAADPFGPPPPLAHTDVSAQARAALTTVATEGPPAWFFGAVLVMAVVDLAVGVGTHAWVATLLDLAALAALATGRRWARALAIVSATLTTVGGCLALAFLRSYLPAYAGPVLVVSVAADAVWLYVLFREDTVRYFSRA